MSHCVDALDPALTLKDPSGHSVQSGAPLFAAYEPAVHLTQTAFAIRPVNGLKLPGAQLVQLATDELPYVPASHGRHVD